MKLRHAFMGAACLPACALSLDRPRSGRQFALSQRWGGALPEHVPLTGNERSSFDTLLPNGLIRRPRTSPAARSPAT